MKKECEIVQDLLFGYVDGTLNNGSKEFVDKHLVECEECKNILKDLQGEERIDVENHQEVDYLKKIKHKMNKKSIAITITSIVLVILVIFNICVYLNYRDFAKNMEVFLKKDVTEEQKEAVKNVILETADNVYIEFNSSENALEELKIKLGESKYLLDNYEGKEDLFPSSYRIRADFDKIDEIKEKLENMEGVEKVVTQTEVNPYVLLYAELFIRDNELNRFI